MTQTQHLQASSASWPTPEGTLEMPPKSLPTNFDREKYRTTGFFARSTIAGGIAGCTVYNHLYIMFIVGEDGDCAA